MKHKSKISTIILIVGCLVGLCLLLYPTVSNYWNNTFATHAIASYREQMTKPELSEEITAAWDEATAHNRLLAQRDDMFSLSDEQKGAYDRSLNLNGNGMMGYIEISRIKLTLPIYHGVDASVLQSAVGHLEWSSLPVGGESTHCVLSGHRGLLSAKLFSDLDMLREGDVFVLYILNETLTYEVDQIRTVDPNDVGELSIAAGKDYCTLVTCTPYGVNTHRLLVRGHRVENAADVSAIISEAVVVDQLMVALCLAIPVLVALLLWVLLKKPAPKPTDEPEETTKEQAQEPPATFDEKPSATKEEHP